MKRFIFLSLMLLAAVSFSGCREKYEKEKDKSAFELYTGDILNPGFDGIQKPYVGLLLACNEHENLLLENDTYVTIEKFYGGILQFLVGSGSWGICFPD